MVHHDCLQGCNANVAICEALAFSCNATSGNRTLKLCCLKQQTPFFQSHLQCCLSLGFSTFTWHSLGPGLVVSLPVLQTLLLSVLVEEQEDWLQLVFFQWHHQIRFGGPFALHQAGNGGISHWHLYHLWGTLHLPFLGLPFLAFLFNYVILVGLSCLGPDVVSLGDYILEAWVIGERS